MAVEESSSWSPLGRPVGTTIHPGMQVTGVLIKEYILPNWNINDICCLVLAWFGSLVTLSTAAIVLEGALGKQKISIQGALLFFISAMLLPPSNTNLRLALIRASNVVSHSQCLCVVLARTSMVATAILEVGLREVLNMDRKLTKDRVSQYVALLWRPTSDTRGPFCTMVVSITINRPRR